ncbi:hypothetical protein BJ912DRAFT_1020063 [Pholiota molesta]|nr:hypothetical protein BJ912DRAFT_1020063 [Pholiota molesta]
MTTPEVVHCPDGHFRKVIYSLGPYIADYPEQVWLAGVVQGWCPKCEANPKDLDANPFMHGFPCADIHVLLSHDLLHQLIKGAFKDHLVAWVNEYIHKANHESDVLEIIHDIDQWYVK